MVNTTKLRHAFVCDLKGKMQMNIWKNSQYSVRYYWIKATITLLFSVTTYALTSRVALYSRGTWIFMRKSTKWYALCYEPKNWTPHTVSGEQESLLIIWLILSLWCSMVVAATRQVKAERRINTDKVFKKSLLQSAPDLSVWPRSKAYSQANTWVASG